MRLSRRLAAGAIVISAAVPLAASGDVSPPVQGRANGPALLRVLGPRAAAALAPATGLVGALVRLPPGTPAEALGLSPSAPGFGRLRARPERIEAFAAAHPELALEVAPPLHPLMDRVGTWVSAVRARTERGADGRGVFIGVADTGLDVTHPDMRDASGRTRVRWMLDLSLGPLGLHPELEDRFGIKDDAGNLVAGAVLSSADIDARLQDIESGACTDTPGNRCTPTDEIGHGTHVTGIATSSGVSSKYPGIAPSADIVSVRVTRSASEGIENDDLVRAVEFMFDRADAEHRPIVANLSLGSDFGPHDGSFLWEQAIASYIGPDKPGHVVVAAAGNSGSIIETPIHQSVRVSPGARMRVPVRTGRVENGSVQIWITKRRGADLRIGLEGPDGEWIAPIGPGKQFGKNEASYNAGVIHGAGTPGSPIPEGSAGAVVVWTGRFPAGDYQITFEGSGMAELYLQGIGDASPQGDGAAGFAYGVREGTINLPATHPAIIGVGCTANRPSWLSVTGVEVALHVPVLDPAGGLASLVRGEDGKTRYRSRDIEAGEVCWFSSAGPTATGVPKPEIAAPGALVISAMSRDARPGTRGGIFTTSSCPPLEGGRVDGRCLQIDDAHGVAIGTSMSSPVVAGVAALLLQQDPTLTQDRVMALLQGGAHRFRSSAPFADQAGPGEVDAMGSLVALEQMHRPELVLPAASTSWMALGSSYVAADGSTPMTAILELRTLAGEKRADLFDARRLAAVVRVDEDEVSPAPTVTRRGPGLYVYEWTPPPGLGGRHVTFGATFDGAPIVASKTVPIAADGWTAAYPSTVSGSGCAATAAPRSAGPYGALGLALGILAVLRRLLPPPGITKRVTPRRS